MYEKIWKAYVPFTTPKRFQESLHCFGTQGNEGIDVSVGKYVPKRKTYGMTISFTNREIVCTGIVNLGAEPYWTEVYSRLIIDMGKETTTFRWSQNQVRNYKKKYRSLARVDISRISDNNIKIKNLIENQKEDEKRMTYDAGVALESDTILSFVKEAENKKKTLLGIKFPFMDTL